MSSKPDATLIDSDYDSAEDSDFDPSSAPAAVDDDFSDDSSSEPEDAAASKPKKRKRALSTTSETASGGLIKTRSQRALEMRSKAGGVSSGAVTTDVDALWAAMNSPVLPKSKPETPETSSSEAVTAVHSETGEKMVSITHTYEFAGKTITEEKLVPASSETARVHLSSSASPKRASAFDSAAASRGKAAQPTKINTLEKSRLDWAGFVDKEGIGDDLKKWNKGDKGYLDRQAFLGRVDENRDRQWKEANKKG
ncbi:bucentaur or craniofacial development-domain-containing protein [Trichophaea hybrida]|nr:bucentaur or craniofacial development-domain-containing protein [Trichophaea hybrida]